MKREIKVLAVTAGVIALAVFYMLYADGKLLLQRDSTLSVSGVETDPDAASSSEAEEGSASQAPGDTAAGEQGFTDQEKEEIRQIVNECFSEAMKTEINESVNSALKNSLDSMIETGQLETAVGKYVSVQEKLVNINTADLERLMTLPGIGQAKATSIIQYREKNGAFASPEQLTEVSGISAGILEKIRDLITI